MTTYDKPFNSAVAHRASWLHSGYFGWLPSNYLPQPGMRWNKFAGSGLPIANKSVVGNTMWCHYDTAVCEIFIQTTQNTYTLCHIIMEPSVCAYIQKAIIIRTWRYRSRSRVITCDTPSHAIDHLYQIWKESILNCRCYRADTGCGTEGRTKWNLYTPQQLRYNNTPSSLWCTAIYHGLMMEIGPFSLLYVNLRNQWGTPCGVMLTDI